MQKWTQDEAVAFECARECITDVMAICSAQIADEKSTANPNAARVQALEVELVRLAGERAKLRGSQADEIARIRDTYGKLIREHRAGHKHPLAA
jgi:hypothetical protein